MLWFFKKTLCHWLCSHLDGGAPTWASNSSLDCPSLFSSYQMKLNLDLQSLRFLGKRALFQAQRLSPLVCSQPRGDQGSTRIRTTGIDSVYLFITELTGIHKLSYHFSRKTWEAFVFTKHRHGASLEEVLYPHCPANPLTIAATWAEWIDRADDSSLLENVSNPPTSAHVPAIKDYKYNHLWQIAPQSSTLNSIW